VLAVPRTTAEGRQRLQSFAHFLELLIETGAVCAGQIQPARSAFFVTIWWHLQDSERWPGFHPSAREAMRREEGLYVPSGQPINDYFAFREACLSLGAAIKLTTWELEYLSWWYRQRDEHDDVDTYYEPGRYKKPRLVRERSAPVAVIRAPVVEREAPEPVVVDNALREGAEHTQVQWLLAKIGRQLGYRVWIASNDRSRHWEGESLSMLSIRRFPSLGLHPGSERLVSLIDVVWLKGANEVAAAFEVEHTSSIYSGLLRMADLTALSPNLSFPLYIVAPRERLEKVRRELSRPTLQALRLHRRCGYFSSEALLDAGDSILQWASEASAIERLATRVEDVTFEGA
jgi:hypothetical protein